MPQPKDRPLRPGEPDEDSLQAALDLLRRTNDFLTLCLTQSEVALDSEDPAELIEALRAIHGGAEQMSGHSRAARLKLIEGSARPETRDVRRSA